MQTMRKQCLKPPNDERVKIGKSKAGNPRKNLILACILVAAKCLGAHAQMNICTECVALANSSPDKFVSFQGSSINEWGSVMHFAISEDDKLYLGEHAVPAGSEVLTQVFRTYLQGKGFDEDSLVKPIQRGIVERTKRQGFSSMELLRIKKDESAYFFPWDEVLDSPSIAPSGHHHETPRVLFSKSVSPKTVTDLMNLMASVLDELRNEMCEEIVGMSYKEVFAEVQKSPASVYANALEYTWRCYPAIKIDRTKYAEPDFLSGTVHSDRPFMVVEQMPALGSCVTLVGNERHACTQQEIIKYVSSNTKYPDEARNSGIEGTVFVYFIVGKEGEIREARALREVHPLLDEEAVRVVESLPTFEPGVQRGELVSVQFTIPVKFIQTGNSRND